jgi:anti-sigma regulatory factor (Ser/Thr protein kinase)
MPRWFWISQGRDIPQRLKSALNPRTCSKIDAANPVDFLLSNRIENPPAGEILVLDGSDGQTDVIQLWLRHLRRDASTSAMPILVWAHSGQLQTSGACSADFSLLPDGVIGRSDWKAQDRWIDRIETILRKRLQRNFRIDVHIDMHSRMESLERTSQWIIDCVRPVPWMADKIGRLRQTIFELGGNAVEWGNDGDPEKTVHIRLRADDRSLHVVVADQGPGFDRRNLPHAAAEEDPIRHLEIREELGLREGGFGLMITRGLVDRMVFNSTGNTVLVTMRQRNKT